MPKPRDLIEADRTLPAHNYKNKLINGNGLINQRAYVSGAVTTIANQYTLDRWRVITLGEALVFSTTDNLTTFTAPLNGVEQIVEGLNLESGTFVISGLLTATCTIDGVAKVNGDTVTVVGGVDVSIKFFNGTFQLPQFEKASRPTPFEYRLNELSLCQKYYYRLNNNNDLNAYIVIGSIHSATEIFTIMLLSVNMRVYPTLKVSDITHFQSVDTGTVRNLTNVVLGSPLGADNRNILIKFSGVSMASGNVSLIRFDGTVGAFIELDAEL